MTPITAAVYLTDSHTEILISIWFLWNLQAP